MNINTGDRFRVLGYEGGYYASHRLNVMGIVKGKVIEIKTIQPAHGPYVIEMNGIEITIGRGIFNKIILEKV